MACNSCYCVITRPTKRVLCAIFKLRHLSISFQWKRIEKFKCKSLTLFRSLASRKNECLKRYLEMYFRHSCFLYIIRSKNIMDTFWRPNFCIWRPKFFFIHPQALAPKSLFRTLAIFLFFRRFPLSPKSLRKRWNVP